MRVFKNESLWDKETQDWVEYFFVDSLMVSSEEFYEQVACEELATEEDEPLVIQCDCEDCVEQRRLESEEQECECSCDRDCENCDSEDRETDYSDCECDECRTQRHEDIVNEAVGIAFDKIMEAEGCPNCIVDALMEFSLEMKRLGWSDHKDYITECNC